MKALHPGIPTNELLDELKYRVQNGEKLPEEFVFVFPVDSEKDDASLVAKVPKGWRAEFYIGFKNKTYKLAIDPDGCYWYWENNEWILNVPWFRTVDGKETAIVEHESGNGLDCEITKNNTIIIGNRRITRKHWNH